MTRTRLTAVEAVPADGSWLFTVHERDGTEEEVVLVRCADADTGAGADAGANEHEAEAETEAGADTPTVEADAEDDTDDVRAWRNFCQHETDQRLDRGSGAAVRRGEIVCPKHGSMFDTCTGYCGNGPAVDSYLSEVEVSVEAGVVYLTDPAVEFAHEGGVGSDGGDEDLGDGDDGSSDDGPSSTSHLTF